MSWASVRAAGRHYRRHIRQEIMCSVEKWGCRSQHVMIYSHKVLGRISQQINASRSANREIITKEDTRNIFWLLGSRKVSFNTLLWSSECARNTLQTMSSYILTCFANLFLMLLPSMINVIIRFDLPPVLAINELRLRRYPWHLLILEDMNMLSTLLSGGYQHNKIENIQYAGQ